MKWERPWLRDLSDLELTEELQRRGYTVGRERGGYLFAHTDPVPAHFKEWALEEMRKQLKISDLHFVEFGAYTQARLVIIKP